MTDIIIKVSYPFRDERLFPTGWRSFNQDLWSINSIEAENEIIGLNKINDEIDTEIIAINDLTTMVFADILGLNELEITLEMISVNHILDAITHEYIGSNVLAVAYTPEIIAINDILTYHLRENEIIGINRIGQSTYTTYSYTVTILLDNVNITDYILSWEINISEDSYVNSARLMFTDKSFFTQCDPTILIGEKRIKITIDGISYEFLLEKRNLNRSPTEGDFDIWGRSHLCTLDMPYSTPLIDKDIVQDPDTLEWSCPDDDTYIPHIWQTGDHTASEIIENIIGADHTLSMEIDDFVIKQGTVSVTGEAPIEFVNKIAKIVGAHVRTDLDDQLIVRYWKFNETGTTVATFTDLESIFMLNESLEFPEGYNRVLVRGYEDVLEDSSVQFSIVLDAELNNSRNQFSFGTDCWFRIYKSPLNVDYTISSTLGDVALNSSNVSEDISQEVSGFGGKTLQADKPIVTITKIELYDCSIVGSDQYSFSRGYKTVTAESVVIEDTPVLISYTSQYDLYKLTVSKPCDPLITDEIISRINLIET